VSQRATGRELAKRRLDDEIAQASKIDRRLARMTLAEILRLYAENSGCRYNSYASSGRERIGRVGLRFHPFSLGPVPARGLNAAARDGVRIRMNGSLP
jgi:hypothetical protein